MLNHVNYIYDEDTAMASAALIDVSLKIPDGRAYRTYRVR